MKSLVNVSDLLSSVVVFLVALPLCLGIAVACGLPPAAGLGAGIVGGLVVGSLSGCPLQVTGPAAGLVTIVWEILRAHGPEGLAVATLLAGALQIALGLLGLGQWFRAVSPAVVKGMLSGIGVAIFASQFHVMFDLAPQASALANLRAAPGTLLKLLSEPAVVPAALCGAVTIAATALWGWRRPRALDRVPAQLVGVVAASLLAGVAGFAVRFVAVPSDLLGSLAVLSPAKAAAAFSWPLLGAAITIALVASAETLLTAAAVDQMHSGPRTRYDKEVVAQGAGNLVAGMLGLIPVTGVIVRSAANVQAGARTRRSAQLHGLWLLLFVVLAPKLLGLIPVASLAGVLVFTGAKLMSPKTAKELLAVGKGELAVYLATVAAIVGTNLLTGIIVGLALATLKLVLELSRVRVDVHHEQPGRVRVRLSGAASFVNIPVLARRLEAVPAGSRVELDTSGLRHVDHAASDLLASWRRAHERGAD